MLHDVREAECHRSAAQGAGFLGMMQRRRRQSPAQPLETVAIVGCDSGGRLEVVTLDLCAQTTHHEGIDVGSQAAQAKHAAATAGAGRDHPTGRSLRHGHQQRRVLHEIALWGSEVPPLELAFDPAEHGGCDRGDVVVSRRRNGGTASDSPA